MSKKKQWTFLNSFREIAVACFPNLFEVKIAHTFISLFVIGLCSNVPLLASQRHRVLFVGDNQTKLPSFIKEITDGYVVNPLSSHRHMQRLKVTLPIDLEDQDVEIYTYIGFDKFCFNYKFFLKKNFDIIIFVYDKYDVQSFLKLNNREKFLDALSVKYKVIFIGKETAFNRSNRTMQQSYSADNIAERIKAHYLEIDRSVDHQLIDFLYDKFEHKKNRNIALKGGLSKIPVDFRRYFNFDESTQEIILTLDEKKIAKYSRDCLKQLHKIKSSFIKKPPLTILPFISCCLSFSTHLSFFCQNLEDFLSFDFDYQYLENIKETIQNWSDSINATSYTSEPTLIINFLKRENEFLLLLDFLKFLSHKIFEQEKIYDSFAWDNFFSDIDTLYVSSLQRCVYILRGCSLGVQIINEILIEMNHSKSPFYLEGGRLSPISHMVKKYIINSNL